MNNHGPYDPDTLDDPVPAYVITGGRAAPDQRVPRPGLRPETLLQAVAPPPPHCVPAGHGFGPGGAGAGRIRSLPPAVPREQIAVLGLCHQLLSVAEVAAHLARPVSVVTVIAADLIDAHLLTTRGPAPQVDNQLLEEVLDGLRKL